MDEHRMARFVVRVEMGSAHGGLFELEETTFFRVVDTRTGETVMTFEGEVQASLSTATGQWDDYRYSGVAGVTLAPDERWVHVNYHDGREETVPLPEWSG